MIYNDDLTDETQFNNRRTVMIDATRCASMSYPDAAPQDTDLEPEIAACLRSLLALPAEALLDRLLGDSPDDPAGPDPWVGYPSPTTLT